MLNKKGMKNHFKLIIGITVLLCVIMFNLSFGRKLNNENNIKLNEFFKVAFAGGEDCWYCWSGDCYYYPETAPCPPGSLHAHYMYCNTNCEYAVCLEEDQTLCDRF